MRFKKHKLKSEAQYFPLTSRFYAHPCRAVKRTRTLEEERIFSGKTNQFCFSSDKVQSREYSPPSGVFRTAVVACMQGEDNYIQCWNYKSRE